jgi:hypothetical protein
MESTVNHRAGELIANGRYAEAEAVLEAALRAMPAHWAPRSGDKEFLTLASWSWEEFVAHSDYLGKRSSLTKPIGWVDSSYSRAWYQLAVVESEQGLFERALFCIDCGLHLEPDHPELWSEKGYLLGHMKRYQEAFDCYALAATVRDWALPSQVARALRGQGVQLIDLERFDEAETALRKSLELDPNSDGARKELDYIEDLRRERKQKKEEIPWFLHTFAHPPTDPVTVRLLPLVEGLPAIPGPATIGAENYSRIVDAFIKLGWPGFEKEFDHIVPRDRSDYADVKRDLLCEPVFSIKAQRNLREAAACKTEEEFKAWFDRTYPEQNSREPEQAQTTNDADQA